jgi:hypothetical protein
VDVGAPHLEEVRALFAQVFGADLAPQLWHWKYADGRGLATGSRGDGGDLLAHYGGTVRTLLVAGEPLGCVQVGDVMVAPQVRGILSRRGPFATAARRLIEGHIGTPGGFACGFGFPNERAARLGEVLGLYVPACRMLQLRWPVWQGLRAHRARLRWRLKPVDWSDPQTDVRLDGLWSGMQRSLAGQAWVLPQRDAAWWRHRFANHPLVQYRCFWVQGRLPGQTLGAVALRPGSQGSGTWELLDWLAFPKNTPALVAAARSGCARWGARELLAWMSEPLVQAVMPAQALSDALVETACFAIWSVRRSPALLLPCAQQWRWWFTGGDTDFR